MATCIEAIFVAGEVGKGSPRDAEPYTLELSCLCQTLAAMCETSCSIRQREARCHCFSRCTVDAEFTISGLPTVSCCRLVSLPKTTL